VLDGAAIRRAAFTQVNPRNTAILATMAAEDAVAITPPLAEAELAQPSLRTGIVPRGRGSSARSTGWTMSSWSMTGIESGSSAAG